MAVSPNWNLPIAVPNNYREADRILLHSRPRERCASYLCVPGMQGSGDLEGLLCPADHCVLLTDPWKTHLKLPGKGWGTPFSVWPTTQAVLE